MTATLAPRRPGLVHLKITGAMPIGDRSDVIGVQDNNGVNLDTIWDEIQTVVELYNKQKNTLVNLLTYRTTNAADAMPQSLSPTRMEAASPVGVPRSVDPRQPYLLTGYTFGDYDLASRLSWLYLRDASRSQIESVVTRMLEADRFTVQEVVFRRLFSPAQESNPERIACYGAWNGNDNIKPPNFMGKTFDTSHNHYITTGSTDLDSEDVELLANHVLEHGFGSGVGSRLLLLMNPADVEGSAITSWRAGVVTANAKKAKFDFVPSSNVPAYLSAENIHGAVPPADIDGIPVLGSYGKVLILESNIIPAGYIAVVATSGLLHQDNALAFREHPRSEWQGLRFIEGNHRRYPIVESFTARGFGVGTRRRGAFAVAHLTANANYTAPTAFAL